jgi:general secretion pathway protein A
MYEAHWQLNKKPFENTPDPDFFYYSQKHEEALSRLIYAVKERKGGTLITGEPGCGKTLLSRVLFKELDNERYHVSTIVNPRLSPLNLLQEIICQLDRGATYSSKTKLLRALNEILVFNRSVNRNTVIIVDEAQTIGHKNSFEELRLLLNFQSNDDFLLTLVLLGQPELKDKINNLPQFKQRFTVRYHLRALTEEESKDYILHRLITAGAQNLYFLDDATAEIYRFSGGVPRRINNICDMALLVGAARELDWIGCDTIREVAAELEEVAA